MNFILGETREIRIRVTSKDTQPFVIRNATCKLINRATNEVIRDSLCTVTGNEIGALILLDTVGNLIVEFSYEIANEVLKATVPIEVKSYANPKY